MTPSEVSKALGISSSTLRKYSLLLEKEQINFERSPNNSRQYTDMHLVALQDIITATKSGSKSLEDAVIEASKTLKGESTITQESTVTSDVPQRYNDDMATAMLAEIQSLKAEIQEQKEVIDGFRLAQEKRDSYFVEILEGLQKEIEKLNEQKALPPVEEVAATEDEQKPTKKGFFSRFFK